MECDYFDLATGSSDKRKGVDPSKLEREKQQLILNIAKAIIQLRDLNYLSARMQKDDFMALAMEKAKELKHEDIEVRKLNSCFYRPKVWLKNGPTNSCEMKWEKIVKVNPKESDPSKIRYRGVNFKQNLNATYGVNDYNGQPKWAQGAIKKTEKAFRTLRVTNEHLSAILMRLYLLSKSVEEYHEMDNDVLQLLEDLGIEKDQKPDTFTKEKFAELVDELHKTKTEEIVSA